MTLREIKGIGPKTEELMNRLQIYTAEDLLRYYPLGYDLYPSPTPVALISPGGKAAVRARVISDVVLRHLQKMTILTCEVSDGEGTLRLTWYSKRQNNFRIRTLKTSYRNQDGIDRLL